MSNLGKYVNIKTGKLDANASSPNGKYPFFTCSKEPLQISSYSYDCECVLVAGNGDLNVKYYNGKFDAYQRTYIIESKDKEILDLRYLYFFIDSKMNFIRNQSIGGVIKYIKLGDLTSLKIPMFDIHKQLNIAATLDKANELIALRKKQLEELDALAESVFYELFGDPVKNEKGWKKGKIRDTIYSINYGTSSPAVLGGKYKYLRMNNITYSGYLDLTDLKYIDIRDKDKEKYLVKKNDLLFNRTNSKELVGKSAIYTKDEEMIIAGYIIRVRCNDSFNPRYVWGYLNCNHGKAYLKKICKNIVGMANINAKELQSIPLLLPPLELQNRFATIIEKIEEQKAQVRKALKESEDLFQRLMQDLFHPS
ncbi:MAG: restriction endonuclease subunit S [Parabacteroides sp.]|nr:restriction endonuclease subunit S [Parabacteroides sp.]